MTVPAHDVDNAEQPDQEVSNEQPDIKPEHNRKTEKEIARESVTPEKPARTNVPESVKKESAPEAEGGEPACGCIQTDLWLYAAGTGQTDTEHGAC